MINNFLSRISTRAIKSYVTWCLKFFFFLIENSYLPSKFVFVVFCVALASNFLIALLDREEKKIQSLAMIYDDVNWNLLKKSPRIIYTAYAIFFAIFIQVYTIYGKFIDINNSKIFGSKFTIFRYLHRSNMRDVYSFHGYEYQNDR